VLQFPSQHSLLQQPDNDEEDFSVWAVDFDSTIKYDWDYVLRKNQPHLTTLFEFEDEIIFSYCSRTRERGQHNRGRLLQKDHDLMIESHLKDAPESRLRKFQEFRDTKQYLHERSSDYSLSDFSLDMFQLKGYFVDCEYLLLILTILTLPVMLINIRPLHLFDGFLFEPYQA
jgi:hypothetical protein